jgi:hypothetical protein
MCRILHSIYLQPVYGDNKSVEARRRVSGRESGTCCYAPTIAIYSPDIDTLKYIFQFSMAYYHKSPCRIFKELVSTARAVSSGNSEYACVLIKNIS